MKADFRLNRRAFLRVALLGGIAAGVGVIYESTAQVGFDRWLRWMLRGNAARVSAPRTRVALAACASYDADILGAVRAAWRDAGLPDPRGLRVVLKPNLVDSVDDHPSYTHPSVVRAMIRWTREQGARSVVVGEGPSFRRDAHGILEATGIAEVLAQEQVDFVDLNYDDLVSIPLKGGYAGLKSLLVARTVAEADLLVSMPKLKTHHWTIISASIKNLFGIVPGIKYGWPKNTLHIRGIPAVLADLADSLPTRTCALVDGIVGMEGDGPLFGTPIPSGVVVAGNDLVAVDATCARLMGFDPAQVDFIRFSGWAGIGAVETDKIELVGEPLARFRRAFAHPPTMGASF